VGQALWVDCKILSIAKRIFDELGDGEEVSSHDSSTNGLINYFKELRGT
jgi:hypothetical protein